ncbi:hypothetical protein TRSC58_07277 [Trypanosoma rangeli SC58]|uniref:Secreted protein n=1 Tax=Trypanosoma rangeli SC58 TaxID=429131 RepID=A0A061IS52_TRYRA|nr:hypothetical protein TRSC58_07277 [Trypanosoma rangeli SC58]
MHRLFLFLFSFLIAHLCQAIYPPTLCILAASPFFVRDVMRLASLPPKEQESCVWGVCGEPRHQQTPWVLPHGLRRGGV